MKKINVLGTKIKVVSLSIALALVAFIVVEWTVDSNLFFTSGFVLLTISLLFYLVLTMAKSLQNIETLAAALERHEMPDIDAETKNTRVISHLLSMYNKMQEIIDFVKSLGKSTFEFRHIDAQGKIGLILTDLSQKQGEYAEEERRRSWKNEGLAKFGEILRMDTQDLKEMSIKILSNIVKYVGANQGGFFIQFEEDEERYMELTACYAYDRKKFVESRIEEGKGLLGQVMLEKEVIFLTEVPEDFVTITSGLGEATPKNLVIIPLIVNEKFYGAIELASFEIIEAYKVEFLQSVAENIASAVAAIKTNENTHRLLEQSQDMAQELQSREEEMRQNMEELQATQEEMARKQLEIDGLFGALNNSQGLAEYSAEGEVLDANPKLLEILGYTLEELKATSGLLLPRFDLQSFWAQLQKGKSQDAELVLETRDGHEIWIGVSYSPVMDHHGVFKKVLVLALDITEKKKKEKEIERLSLVADNTDNSVVITDPNGLIEYVNPGFVKLTGYTLEEVAGKKPGDVLQGPKTDPQTVKRISQKLKSRQPLYDEILNYSKAGESYWISLAINPVFKDGKLQKFISIQANITETKEKALDYHYQLQAISRSNAVIEFDPKGHILTANDNFLKIFKYKKEEIIGKHHKIFVRPDVRESEDYKHFWSRLGNGEYINEEFQRIDRNGNEIWLQGVYNPIYNLHGQITKIVKFAFDITRERLLQIETEHQQAEIRSHLETIDKTIASIEFDIEGTISYVNEVYLNVSGYSKEELLGHNYKYLLAEGESDKPQTQMMWMSLKEGNYFTGQFKQKSKCGKSLWLRGAFNPILDEKGMPTKVMMFAQFNTQEMEKKEDLTQTVNALKQSMPIMELNMDKTFKSANGKFFELIEYSRLETRQKSIEFFLDSSMSRGQLNSFNRKFDKREFFEEVLILQSKSGVSKAFRVTFNPIKNLEQEVVKMMAILVDEMVIPELNPSE